MASRSSVRKINIIAVGHRYPPWAAQAEAGYVRQLARFDLKITTIKPAPTPEKEAAAVMAALPRKPTFILLDEAGEKMTSAQFTAMVNRLMAADCPPVFVIAGADGAATTLRAAADAEMSLSALTFPHALARLLLVEQLFRADCAMRGHPYPR